MMNAVIKNYYSESIIQSCTFQSAEIIDSLPKAYNSKGNGGHNCVYALDFMFWKKKANLTAVMIITF